MKLVIVESPAKAKTINKYLGSDYKVIASFGHIRDLPSKPGSVDPAQDFMMKYEISDKSKKYVKEIEKYAKQAEAVYLATDPDREGEAISWHVAELLKQKKIIKEDSKFKRIAFNEITKTAITRAVQEPRCLDSNLIDAQQARRALDYLVGFTLSPLLWRKLPGCRSAGRVQSVALRLICEREDAIERFKSREYWDIILSFLSQKGENFAAKLSQINGEKLKKFSIEDQQKASELKAELEKAAFEVTSITKKEQRRKPPAPFITSSLQQEAARKLGFSAKKTMQIAQKLYEGIDIDGETIGLITYMRTDGVTLSTEATKEIRSLVGELYGQNYLPKVANIYKAKSKTAQEAHEAIRPTNIKLMPQACTGKLDSDQLKLYELIWQRTMACQMEKVIIDMVGVDLTSKDKKFIARANGSVISFDGFYKIYQEGKDDSQEEKNNRLPLLNEQETVTTKEVTPEQHFTEAPPRFSEASLVKNLEELGIGRPSTYATIISVLQDRKYVTLEKKRFFPSDLGRLVTAFLAKFFNKYVEYDFTAELENELDQVAAGQIKWKYLLGNFWTGFNDNISRVGEYQIADVIEQVEKSLEFHLYGEAGSEQYQKNKKCPACSDGTLCLKLGKYGAFLACSNYPDCTFKKSVMQNNEQPEDSSSVATEIAANQNQKLLGEDKQNNPIYLKKGPYGWYVQLGEAEKDQKKPKRSPVPPTLVVDKVDLAMAEKLLSLPLKIGLHPETKAEINMGIGKYGPYLKYQNKFTSIPKNHDPFALTLEQAIEIIQTKNTKSK